MPGVPRDSVGLQFILNGTLNERSLPQRLRLEDFSSLVGLAPTYDERLANWPGNELWTSLQGQKIIGLFPAGTNLIVQTDTQLVRFSLYELQGLTDPNPVIPQDPPFGYSDLPEEEMSQVLLKYNVASGTVGPSITTGSAQQLSLNTEVIDTDGNCALAANQFTLSAGAYPQNVRLKALFPISFVRQSANVWVIAAQLILRNVTAGSDVITGITTRATVDSNAVAENQLMAYLEHSFSLAASTTFEMRVFARNVSGSGGQPTCFQGRPITTGASQETYGNVEILIAAP